MPEDEEAAAAAAQPAHTPCAACKTLRRRCVPDCVFAPYFPAEGDGPSRRFEALHRVFGASNAARMLRDVDRPEDRRAAADTLVEEALARLRDPTFGCVSLHGILLMRNHEAREQVDALREEIAREFGAAEAASLPVDVAAASPEEKMEARALVDRALEDARKQDAELLADRRAFDIEWFRQQRQAAKRAAGEGLRVPGGCGRKDSDASERMVEMENTAAAAGESSSEKTMLTPQDAAAPPRHHLAAPPVVTVPDSLQGNGHPRLQKMAETKESAPAAPHAGAEGYSHGEMHKQSASEEEALASKQAPAAELQHHGSATTQLGGAGTSSFILDVPAAEELAKKLDAMIQKSAAAQHYDDPAAARYASLGLDVTPRLHQPPHPRDMARQVAAGAQEEAAAAEAASDQGLMMMLAQQIAGKAAAAEQDMLIQLLAKQYGVHDTELDITLGHGHPDMHQQTTEAQLVAAAFPAGEASGEQGLTMPHAAAAELVRQKMMQYTQAELDITLGRHGHQHGLPEEIVQQLAAAAELAREQGIMPEVAAAELAREQALIMQQTKQQEEEMTLLLEAAAAALQRPVAAQYTDTGVDISPEHHQPTVQQMVQVADAVQVAREPNTTAVQQEGAEHWCAATVGFQPPGYAEASPFLVGQQPPPQGQTAMALGLQLDPSLLPLLGQPSARVQQQ